MKKMSKLFGVIGFMMILCFGCFTNTVKAASNTDYTMDDVKQMLDAYLEENHPNIVFGTDEYTEYLVEQLVEGTDENLKLDSNAELMMDFASIYLYEIDDPSINTYSMQSKTNYDSFKNKTLEELIEEIAEDEKKISNEPAPIDSIGPAAKYNISNATSYAKKWANSFNPNYKQQSSDCTNFVSQILSAGSLYGIIPQHNLPSGMTSDTSYWYYINSKQMSTSFIRVADFYTFYSTRVSKTDTTSKTTAISKVKEGDVVLLKRASTGARYHAIYISKKSNSKAYYCGHTNARLDEDFNNINDSSNDYTIFSFNSYSNN